MTYLTYNSSIRSEINQEIIDNLIRKGWKITTPPPYNKETEHAVWENGQWIIKILSSKPSYPVLLAPSSISSSGKVGEIRWDNEAVYVCIATDTWKKSTLVDF